MTSSAKTVQCHNGMQNHQNGHPLPVLDLNVAGYEAVELFQWVIKSKTLSFGSMKLMDKINSQYSWRQEKGSK
eukprot:8028801-Ditylum_brightwellii.AAC.1